MNELQNKINKLQEILQMTEPVTNANGEVRQQPSITVEADRVAMKKELVKLALLMPTVEPTPVVAPTPAP